jgi:5-oxoprolinase (ATP-hydrolysing)
VEVRRRRADLRLAGQESTVEVEWRPDLDLPAAFASAYRALYGYAPGGRPVELESLSAVASSHAAGPAPPAAAVAPVAAGPAGRRRAWQAGAWREVPVFERRSLVPGSRFAGPALVVEPHTTAVVAGGWVARIDGAGALVLRWAPNAPGGA